MIASLALLLLVQGPADSSAGPAVARNHVFLETSVAVGARSPYGVSGLTVGLHLTSAPPNAAGLDFGISSYVDPLTHGSANVLTDLDAAYLSWGPAQPRVLLRAGLTTLLMHGLGLGLNAGAGLIVPVGSTAALRIDYTYRRFSGDLGVHLSGLSAGFGIDY